MANREENIEKIYSAIKKLSDEELENVARLISAENIDDRRFLSNLNGFFTRYGKSSAIVGEFYREGKDN